ncbi:MAG: hypothetical protein QOF30_3463, partial [Acidimicrobiaceae bacterium]|nr:hypothetical protein [Acidimicrobiaceae bacterium]
MVTVRMAHQLDDQYRGPDGWRCLGRRSRGSSARRAVFDSDRSVPLHQVRARLRRAAGLAHNAVTVARWPTGDDSRAHQVTRGIRASVLRRPDDRLQAQIAMIERRRRELEARRDLVEMLDFGAGSNFANPAAALGTDPARTVRTPVGELCRRASRGPEWGRLMAAITRSTRPGAVLEMGACMGLSACYFGAALRANGGGRIVTIEGAPALASIAEETVREVGLHDVVEVRTGTFAELLGPTLDELGTTDLAFVDG